MITRRWIGLASGMTAVALGAAGCGSDGSSPPGEGADEVTIDWVSFQPESHPEVERVRNNFWAPIEEETDLQFQYRGGPDTMSPADMGAAVRDGTVDVAMIYVGAYESIVNGAGAWTLTEFSPEEERENGAAEFFDQLHRENGLKYIARVQPQEENFFFTWLRSERVETVEDFREMVIGSAAGAQAAVPAWGAALESVALPDNYTALERGVVDGLAGQPLEGAVANGWHELVDYVIDEPYYQSSVVLIMNLETWDGLDEETQQLLTEAAAQAEAETVTAREAALAEAKAQIEDAGVEFYELDSETAEWYVQTAYDASWADQEQRFPDIAAELREKISQ